MYIKSINKNREDIIVGEVVTKRKKFSLSNLDLGLYLVVTEKIENSDYSLSFESFLVSVPNLDKLGYWDYDLDVFPKVSEYIKNSSLSY